MARMIKSKDAQITVFMIVGIILLFSSAVLFYIRGQLVTEAGGEFIPVAEEVPLEAQPIKIFTENCLKKVGTDAVRKLGNHGGYVNPSDSEMSGDYFTITLDPTESDALDMLDDKKALMPYWWYLKSSNDCSGTCVLDSNRPALRKGNGPSVEGQIDLYINKYLKVCLNDFQDFREQGFEISERGSVKSNAVVTEKDVSILLEYPITVSREGRKIDINSFFTKLDVNLKLIYDTATDITNLEMNKYFLELHAMNLLTLAAMPPSADGIPPIADSNFDFGDVKVWTRSETQRKIESNVLTTGMRMLQVYGSRNYNLRVMIGKNGEKYAMDRITTGVLSSMDVPLNLSKDYRNVDISFTYLDWWPIYLNINDQEVLMPNTMQGSGILSFIGFNNYAFWYDLSFPVMVTIKDYEAFEGKGYEFRFALEGNIRDNNHTSGNYTNLARDAGESLACDRNQRNTGMFNIETKDALTGVPVSARVDFVLGAKACLIGITKKDENNKTVLSAPLPVGWGFLRVNNQSYLLDEKRLVTRTGVGENITVNLMPYKFINATIFVRGLNYDGQTKKYVLPASAGSSPLSPKTEKAFFIFKRVNDSMMADFKTFFMVSSSSDVSTLRIVPGDYEVKGYLFYDSNMSPVMIPQEHFEFDAFFGLKEVPIDLNRTIMNPYMKGGAIFNNETGFLHIDKDDLFNSNKVVFYVLRFPTPSTHSETLKNAPGLEQLTMIDDYTGIYRESLVPDWLE